MDTVCRNASGVLILLEDFDITPDAERYLRMLAVGALESKNTTSRSFHLSESTIAANFSSCFNHDIAEILYSFQVCVLN